MNNIKFSVWYGSVPFRLFCKGYKISAATKVALEDALWYNFCMSLSNSLFVYYPEYPETIWIGGYFLNRDVKPTIEQCIGGISHESLHDVLWRIDEPKASASLDKFVHVENIGRTGLNSRLKFSCKDYVSR